MRNKQLDAKKKYHSEVLEILTPLSFEDKIKWFLENYDENRNNLLEYELTDENFLCFAIAEQKREDRFESYEHAILVETEFIKRLIYGYENGEPGNLDAFKIVRVKKNLKYLERLSGQSSEYVNDLFWENKTELSELIYSLWKSNRILSKGTPILQKDLIVIFEKRFNVNLNNFHDLLREGKSSAKRSIDKKYFMNELLNYVEKYKED